MNRVEIFTEAHRLTREQSFRPAGYKAVFASYLRMLYTESKKTVVKHIGFVKMDNTVIVLRETEKALLIGCKTNSFEIWTPKSQTIIKNGIFVKTWIITKNRNANKFVA